MQRMSLDFSVLYLLLGWKSNLGIGKCWLGNGWDICGSLGRGGKDIMLGMATGWILDCF